MLDGWWYIRHNSPFSCVLSEEKHEWYQSLAEHVCLLRKKKNQQFSCYLQFAIQETRLRRRNYRHCAEISVCLLKHSCTKKLQKRECFINAHHVCTQKKTLLDQKYLQTKRKSKFKHFQDVCGLFSIPTIIFTTMSPLKRKNQNIYQVTDKKNWTINVLIPVYLIF